MDMIIGQSFKIPCYIMDFLPKQVPMNCGGQFFEVGNLLDSFMIAVG